VAVSDELEKLKVAFPVHRLDAKDAFREWGGTHVDGEAFRRGVTDKTWDVLPAAFLEHHHDALVFLGPSTITDYLPAYVSAFARRDPALSAMPSFLLGVLTRSGDGTRFDERFAQLSKAQRQAVGRVLIACETELAGKSQQREVSDALDSYWRSQVRGVG
jgi:hypothetical protein